MNTRIKKKKAFSVVNEATEFTLRVKHPDTFIKEGYKLMKVFKAEPKLFVKIVNERTWKNPNPLDKVGEET